MGSEWRNIGDILVGFGRITEEQVGQAVEHQQEHGGYFGEALLALGLVSQEELEWGLASQYDLPYVFPDADTIDPEAAALVTPEWALAHLALPIMKTRETLTVIVDSPTRSEAIEELQLRSDLKIEIALASAGKIRDLIRQVYARAAGKEDEAESRVPLSLREGFATAMDHGARRFGISTRGLRASIWYKEGGRIRRRPLDRHWRSELDELVVPPPGERTDGVARAEWSGHLNQNGIVSPVEVRFLAAETGTEYLFRPSREAGGSSGGFAPPPESFAAEIRLLARSGSARFVVAGGPGELGRALLPHLPALLFDPSWRSVHVTDREGDGQEEVFSVRVPGNREEQAAALLELHPFGFDVVTADLSGPLEGWVTPVLNLAASAFLLRNPEADDPERDRGAAREAGIRWEVTVEQDGEGALVWELHPLKG